MTPIFRTQAYGLPLDSPSTSRICRLQANIAAIRCLRLRLAEMFTDSNEGTVMNKISEEEAHRELVKLLQAVHACQQKLRAGKADARVMSELSDAAHAVEVAAFWVRQEDE